MKQMKKVICLAVASLLLLLAMVSCDPKPKDEGGESGKSEPSVPMATVDTSPDAPFNGEDDEI